MPVYHQRYAVKLVKPFRYGRFPYTAVSGRIRRRAKGHILVSEGYAVMYFLLLVVYLSALAAAAQKSPHILGKLAPVKPAPAKTKLFEIPSPVLKGYKAAYGAGCIFVRIRALQELFTEYTGSLVLVAYYGEACIFQDLRVGSVALKHYAAAKELIFYRQHEGNG